MPYIVHTDFMVIQVAAVASGIDYEFQFMDLMKGEHMSEWFLKLNPKEKSWHKNLRFNTGPSKTSPLS